MTPRPRADRTAKRAELASAASRVFAEKGVANTAISDIVRAAGVSQGSFYLYFDSKEDLIEVLVEHMVDEVLAAMETSLASNDAPPVGRLLTLIGSLAAFDSDPSAIELADFIHRRENRALHDRLTEHLAERMAVIVEQIVAEGIADGSFDVTDSHAAAWFVLGGLQSVELRELPAAEVPKALDEAARLALKTLGYRGQAGASRVDREQKGHAHEC